jgi:AraC family transcriptional regulator
MVHAITAMAADIRGGHAHGAMYGESIGAALLARIVTQHAGKAVSLDSHASFGKLQQARVRDFVHEHLAADLSLAAMAALLQCDVYTLTRWFKSVFGLPPHRYVLRQRVQRSQSLLHSTTLPLTEIALQCGFYSHSHFTGVFKRHVGTTPNQYRLKRRP